MTFLELQTEFYARGFAYLDDGGAGETRAKAFINGGMRDLCGLEPWPFLQAVAVGTAPLVISDLRDISYVTTPTGTLNGRDVSVFLGDDPTLTQTGTAQYWWLNGQTELNTSPVDSSTALTVAYLRVPTDMSVDGDVPIVPSNYHDLIVDFAVIRALRDRSNHAEATAVRAGIEERLDMMRNALLNEADWFQTQTEPSNA